MFLGHSSYRVKRRSHGGFTLVELLVVIAIIGILVAIVVPAVLVVRESARNAKCQNNLKQLGLALHSYHDAFGSLPPAATYIPEPSVEYQPAWGTMLLPFVEQNVRYDNYQFGKAFVPTGEQLPLFQCPSDYEIQLAPGIWLGALVYVLLDLEFCFSEATEYYPNGQVKSEKSQFYYGDNNNSGTSDTISVGPMGLSSYSGNYGSITIDPTSLVNKSDGIFSINSQMRFAGIERGLSNTFAIGESSFNKGGRFTGWEAVRYDSSTGFHTVGNVATSATWSSTPSPKLFTGFGSQHTGTANFVMCDGSVQKVKNTIDHRVFAQQSSRTPFE